MREAFRQVKVDAKGFGKGVAKGLHRGTRHRHSDGETLRTLDVDVSLEERRYMSYELCFMSMDDDGSDFCLRREQRRWFRGARFTYICNFHIIVTLQGLRTVDVILMYV